GCPDVPGISTPELSDTDQDGIPDDLDACPLERENFNKFQDTDGCPDILEFKINEDVDSDGDGVPDNNDSCPFSPETYNKF
ncbi:MAG: thrombospondin type 3 repeat-containing protein, partial [Nitrosopumilus sp.]